MLRNNRVGIVSAVNVNVFFFHDNTDIRVNKNSEGNGRRDEKNGHYSAFIKYSHKIGSFKTESSKKRFIDIMKKISKLMFWSLFGSNGHSRKFDPLISERSW